MALPRANMSVSLTINHRPTVSLPSGASTERRDLSGILDFRLSVPVQPVPLLLDWTSPGSRFALEMFLPVDEFSRRLREEMQYLFPIRLGTTRRCRARPMIRVAINFPKFLRKLWWRSVWECDSRNKKYLTLKLVSSLRSTEVESRVVDILRNHSFDNFLLTISYFILRVPVSNILFFFQI